MNVRETEREWRRVDRIVSKSNYNPLDIFCLQRDFVKRDIRMAYYKIARLLHPDKCVNNERFCRMFTIVNDNYRLLMNPQKRAVCCKARKMKRSDILKKLFTSDSCNSVDNNSGIDTVNEDLRIVVWKPLEIIEYNNNVQLESYKIVSKIAMRGAEHRKNKSKSKRDKHQKGLKQRVIQKRNAERRIVNHHFSFTNNIDIEYST